ncbi:hypothetical protein V1290_000431 [Bradyrhizobium sp. AZCC 1578]|uniref:hypothetical protein n=1 Tax=Bradyrhizobium sp. AZCC 1578 TaxID=3117027 RepID=UPI002FF22A47
MRFVLPEVDLRRDGGSRSIDDQDGNVVGQLLMNQNVGRTIILLGKYQGTFKTQEECAAFARGVEVVISHLTKVEM